MVDEIAEIVEISPDQGFMLRLDAVFPNGAHLASRGKVPDKPHIQCKSIEINIILLPNPDHISEAAVGLQKEVPPGIINC